MPLFAAGERKGRWSRCTSHPFIAHTPEVPAANGRVYDCHFFLLFDGIFVFQIPYDVVLLGGLSGRLDQTIHTLSFLHKLRKSGRRIFAVTDENVGWVLDEVRFLFYFILFFIFSS